MIDMGPLAFYIRFKVTQDQEKWTIKLLQPSYIKKLLDYYGICKIKTAKIPIQNIILLSFDMLISELEKAKYLAKVGSIIYVIVETCINITFATSMVSKLSNNPSLEYFHAIDQILRYLAEN